MDGARGGSRRLGDQHGCSYSIRSGAASSLLPPFRARLAERRAASCAGSPGRLWPGGSRPAGELVGRGRGRAVLRVASCSRGHGCPGNKGGRSGGGQQTGQLSGWAGVGAALSPWERCSYFQAPGGASGAVPGREGIAGQRQSAAAWDLTMRPFCSVARGKRLG